MNKIIEEFSLLNSIIKGIAMQFGDKCEVVLHDFSNGMENTIVAIENGQVTGRKVGDSPHILNNVEKKGSIKDVEDKYNYITHTTDGKILRSTTIYIKNDNGENIGAICTNFDITELIVAETAIRNVTGYGHDTTVKEVFSKNVNELLDYFLQECIEEFGKPGSLMTKEEKMKAIAFLDSKGAFLITKAGNKVCDFFKISKFTLYNYLDETRNK